VVTERARFVLEAEQSFLSFAALCRRHGISRPTGHKWLRRYREQGLEGLEDRSHRPHSCPHATPASVVERILEVRRQRGWGAPKIRRKLEDEISQVPSVDAVHRVLLRHGLIEHRKPRRRRTHPGPPNGGMKLMASLLYGSGLRLMECLRLRVKDVDFDKQQLVVRDGKGAKDRATMLPDSLAEPLRRHLDRVELLHEQDLASGFGSVHLPHALARKYPNAPREWAWQYVFPSARISRATPDPTRGGGTISLHHRSRRP
jgi:integrase